MLNVCDKVNLLGVGVFSPCCIKSHTSIRQKIECFFIFKLSRESKVILQINPELLQINVHFKL